MRIANPMYYGVLQHLLADRAAVRLLIGTLIGEEIDDIAVHADECSVRLPGRGTPQYDIGQQRIDLAATLRTAGGERTRVLIAVQNARDAGETMRFRRYLGRQSSDDIAVLVELDSGRQPLRMLAVHFLGGWPPHADATVVKVARQHLDSATGERPINRGDLAEALSHDCYVANVSRLADRRRIDLEKLLRLFDQAQRMPDPHVLEIDEWETPRAYRPVVRRLEAAAWDRDVVENMRFEDEVEEAWEGMERRVAIAEHDKAIAEADRIIAERDRTIAALEESVRRLTAAAPVVPPHRD